MPSACPPPNPRSTNCCPPPHPHPRNSSYIVKWVQAMEAHGIPIWAITPQNEPEARQSAFESCAFDIPHYLEWLGTYLGPALSAAAPHVTIMAYDHNKLDAEKYITAISADPAAAAAWGGTAIHWYDYQAGLGLEGLDAIHDLAPGKPLLGTEACFLESLIYNWDVGMLYAVDIIGDLAHHVGGWLAWNAVLLTGTKFPESEGGPNHDNTTHFGDPILLEYNASGTQRLLFQSSYYVLGHFSRFMLPGAFVITTAGGGTAELPAQFEALRNRTSTCARRNCEPAAGLPLMSVGWVDRARGSAGVVVANANAKGVGFKLSDVEGKRSTSCSIPGESIQTYTFAI